MTGSMLYWRYLNTGFAKGVLMKKTVCRRIVSSLLAAAFVFSAVRVPAVRAQEPGDRRENLVLHHPVEEALVKDLGPETFPVPEELRSDTLNAITDGVAYPETPHAGPGENPYAWTNYKAAQTGNRVADVIVTLGYQAQFREVVLYHFVDSWSADLPDAVQFFARHLNFDGNVDNPTFEERWVQMELVSRERVTDTCYRSRYRVPNQEYVSCEQLRIRQIAKVGEKHAKYCTGLYEVEIYNVPEEEGFWTEAVFSADDVSEIIVGSAEAKDRCKKENAMDGNPLTQWHTDWRGCAEQDRYITLQLKEKQTVTGIRYEARYGTKDGDNNGRIRQYVVEGCTEYGDWIQIASGFLPDREGVHDIMFLPHEVTAIRLRGTSTYGNIPDRYMSAAEIALYGRVYTR